MFLSERLKGGGLETGLGQVEAVSVGGADPTVAESGGQYGARLFGPGGVCWVPRRGQSVLVIKAGAMSEESCMVGAETPTEDSLAPGELRLFAEGCALELKNNGSIYITGKVYINGKEVSP